MEDAPLYLCQYLSLTSSPYIFVQAALDWTLFAEGIFKTPSNGHHNVRIRLSFIKLYFILLLSSDNNCLPLLDLLSTIQLESKFNLFVKAFYTCVV